jgi:hypothetical protein
MALNRDSIIMHKEVTEYCFVCDTTEHLTTVGSKLMCYGCEHELFYAEKDMELMTIMYGYE